MEYAPDGTYFWTDVNSLAIKRDITDSDAQWDVVGTQIARVKYVDGKIVTPKSSDVQVLSNSKLGAETSINIFEVSCAILSFSFLS